LRPNRRTQLDLTALAAFDPAEDTRRSVGRSHDLFKIFAADLLQGLSDPAAYTLVRVIE
jgi:hypothetical protein